MNVIVNGALGRMGQQVCKLLEENGLTLAAAVDRAGGEGVYQSLTDYTGPADVVIDFSNHASAQELVDYCKNRNLPLVPMEEAHYEVMIQRMRALGINV